MYQVCQLILAVFKYMSHKVFGRGLTDQLYSLSEDNFLLCVELSERRVWYGQWVMITSGIVSLLSSRSVIEFGVRSDMICRNICHVTGIDAEPFLPPYYACIKVRIYIHLNGNS